MDYTEGDIEQLLEKFITWAESRSDIRAAAIVGSRARLNFPGDEWSDLNLWIITTDPELFLAETEWLEAVGHPWLTFVQRTATGHGMERRVLFEGGLDVDFTPISVEEAHQMAREGLPPRVANVIQRGIRFIVDKDDLADLLDRDSLQFPETHPPTQYEFLEHISNFLYHAVLTAKKVRRRELWTAKFCLDHYMKWQLLLRMIEWHAKTIHGWEYDTWYEGRFLEQWADPRVLSGFSNAFSYYDEEDIKRALLVTIDLFRWLAMETAENLGYRYPISVDGRLTDWVRACLAEQPPLDLLG